MENTTDIVIRDFLEFLNSDDYSFGLFYGKTEIFESFKTDIYKLFDTDQRLLLKKKSGDYVMYIVLDDDRLLCIDEIAELDPYKKTFEFYIEENASKMSIISIISDEGVSLEVRSESGWESADELDKCYSKNIIPDNFHLDGTIRPVSVRQLIRRGTLLLLNEPTKAMIDTQINSITRYVDLYAISKSETQSRMIYDMFCQHCQTLADTNANVSDGSLNVYLVYAIEERINTMINTKSYPIKENDSYVKTLYDFYNEAVNIISSQEDYKQKETGEDNAK